MGVSVFYVQAKAVFEGVVLAMLHREHFIGVFLNPVSRSYAENSRREIAERFFA